MSLAYDYYPSVLWVIDRLSQGRTETASCNEAGIAVATFKTYLRNDKRLMEMYEEAMQIGHDAMADALLDPQGHAIYGSTDPKMAKVYSDNIKWFLGKRNQKMYGEKLEVKHEVTVAFAITNALEQAARRVSTMDIRQIEGVTYTDVTPVAEQTDEEILAELMR